LTLALEKSLSSRALNLPLFLEGLKGQDHALIFSKLEPAQCHAMLEALLKQSRFMDYARKGTVMPETIQLPVGPLTRNDEPLPHTLERTLRQLGLPLVLKKGLLYLEEPFTICQQGESLSISQAEVLRHFFIQFPLFDIKIIAHLHAAQPL
jgi:mRNA turnover protein 4